MENDLWRRDRAVLKSPVDSEINKVGACISCINCTDPLVVTVADAT